MTDALGDLHQVFTAGGSAAGMWMFVRYVAKQTIAWLNARESRLMAEATERTKQVAADAQAKVETARADDITAQQALDNEHECLQLVKAQIAETKAVRNEVTVLSEIITRTVKDYDDCESARAVQQHRIEVLETTGRRTRKRIAQLEAALVTAGISPPAPTQRLPSTPPASD